MATAMAARQRRNAINQRGRLGEFDHRSACLGLFYRMGLGSMAR